MVDSFTTSLSLDINEELLKKLVKQVLIYAIKIGSTSASVGITNNFSLSVSVRNGLIETVEQANNRSLSLTLYSGKSCGSVSTSDFSDQSLNEAIRAAWNLACHTISDPDAGLPDQDALATEFPDLDLYHPWYLSTKSAAGIAYRAEKAALDVDSCIDIDDVSINTYEGQLIIGNTLGFIGGYIYSNHSLSVSSIASNNGLMQRDYWYTTNRNPILLENPEFVGKRAAERTIARLSARRICTGKFPVLFEAPVALSLLGNFARAASGTALYRKTSYLLGALGKKIFSNHIDIIEDPYITGGMGSAAFDNEGVRTQKRKIVSKGILKSYFLSTYTARKLKMLTTGNSGGAHNLIMYSNNTSKSDDFESMLKKMNTGLLVTELIGQGVNYVTGDYSRGVFGYWIENGKIQHAVQEVTIAGNLNDMFQNIVAIGSDIISRENKTVGSILIESMTIAGNN